MQLELHLLQPVRDIRVIHALNKHRPAMRMICRDTFWFGILDRIEWAGCCAKDEGTQDLYALDAFLGT